MSNEQKLPGITVGQLRDALAGYDPDMPVIVRARDEDENSICGGILVAEVEADHYGEGGPAFVIDASSNAEEFDE